MCGTVAPECVIGWTANKKKGFIKNNSHLIQSHSSPRRQENHCNDDTVSWRPEEMYSINKKKCAFLSHRNADRKILEMKIKVTIF
jgi:hypothetical protein